MNTILSVASTCLLLWLSFTGGVPRLHEIEVAFDAETISIHPTWVVNVPQGHPILGGAQGKALFNVAIVADETIECRQFVKEHEVIHTRQFRALGVWMLPLYLIDEAMNGRFLNFEGYVFLDTFLEAKSSGVAFGTHLYDWQLDLMWSPPEGWPNRWSLVSMPVY